MRRKIPARKGRLRPWPFSFGSILLVLQLITTWKEEALTFAAAAAPTVYDEACVNIDNVQEATLPPQDENSESSSTTTTTTTASLRGAAARHEQDSQRPAGATANHPPTFDPTLPCHDLLSNCATLLGAETPEHNCIEYFTYMYQHCAATCGFCSANDPALEALFRIDAPARTIDRIFHAQPQVVAGLEAMNTWLTFRHVEDYMYQHVYQDETFRSVRHDCINQHELCTFWATVGECDLKPKYMAKHCAPACQLCHTLHVAKEEKEDPQIIDPARV